MSEKNGSQDMRRIIIGVIIGAILGFGGQFFAMARDDTDTRQDGEILSLRRDVTRLEKALWEFDKKIADVRTLAMDIYQEVKK